MVERGIEALVASGDAYEREGALWFRTTDYGDEKDRVLRRSDGSTTYLAADVAYHLDKAGRGDDRLLDVLGADHHGYIARLRAVIAAGGHDPDMLEVGNGGMSVTEYESHFSLWAMLAAPLIAGNDLRQMDADTRRILMNAEVIRVDQDPLGRQGRRRAELHGDSPMFLEGDSRA